MGREPFLRWFLKTFTTRAHFMRFLATALVAGAMAQIFIWGDAHDGLLALASMAVGYYFKPHAKESGHED